MEKYNFKDNELITEDIDTDRIVYFILKPDGKKCGPIHYFKCAICETFGSINHMQSSSKNNYEYNICHKCFYGNYLNKEQNQTKFNYFKFEEQ